MFTSKNLLWPMSCKKPKGKEERNPFSIFRWPQVVVVVTTTKILRAHHVYVNPLQYGTIPIWCCLIQDLWKPECSADLYDDFESMKKAYEILPEFQQNKETFENKGIENITDLDIFAFTFSKIFLLVLTT